MTLILGIHFPKKIYLVADTRITEEKRGGIFEYKDDFIKTFKINPRITAAAAGNARFAFFVLSQLKQKIGKNGTISELKKIIKKDTQKLMADYVNKTGLYKKIALIFAGYNDGESKKKINASLLGRILAAPSMKQKGVMTHPSIDKKIIGALVKRIQEKGGRLEKDECIEINGLDSRVFSLEIDLKTAKHRIKNAACFEYLMFYPNQKIKKIKVPDEIISFIEFREKKFDGWDENLTEEVEMLMSFVYKTIIKNNFSNVGGVIIPFLITPENDLFKTGTIGYVRNGVIAGTAQFYIKDDKFCYKFSDGREGEYRRLQNHTGGEFDFEL